MAAENVDSPSADSSSSLMKEFDKGVMKVPLVFDGKIHDSCPPILFEDGTKKQIDRYWNDRYLQSMNTAISHIQDWFTKISFNDKLAFIRQIIPKMSESRKLFDVAYFIGPPLKDSVYARTIFTRTPHDLVPMDHNRAVDINTHTHYIVWFESLSDQEQFDAIMGLARLGGSALQEKLYEEVVEILQQKERDLIRREVLEYLAKKKGSPKVVASKIAKKKRRYQKGRHTVNDKSTQNQKENELNGEEEGDDYVSLLKEKLDAYNNALNAMKNIARGTSEINHSQTALAKMKPNPSKNRHLKRKIWKNPDKMNVNLDRIQMLPLWDNRRIVAFLPEKTLRHVMTVDRYWREMVVKAQKEIKMRNRIDEYLHPRKSLNGVFSGGAVKEDHFKRGRLKKERSPDSKGTNLSEGEEKSTPEDFLKRLDVQQLFSGDRSKFNPFSNPYQEYVICDMFCDDRVMDATHRWAAYSNKTDVEFCNVIFGVPCHLRLRDAHEQKISCIRFHPDGAHVFTGGFDGMVKQHDVWRQGVKLVYPGHSGIVTDVDVTCRYVASCGVDNQVRVFNIADGKCVFCLKLKHSPSRLVLTKCGNPSLYLANSSGELLMYDLTLSKTLKQVGQPVDAHRGEITSLMHYPCSLISTGVDGFARMWTTHFEAPKWIVSLKHPVRVNSADLSHRKIITACEDGKIRIWNVLTSACEKVIGVVVNSRPILDVACFVASSTVKLVVSSEVDIKVLEFPFRSLHRKRPGRSASLVMKPIADLRKKIETIDPALSAYEKRMMNLHQRQAVHPQIRPSPGIPTPSKLILDSNSSTSDLTKRSQSKFEAK